VRVCVVDQPGGAVQWLTGNGPGGGSLNRPGERERRDAILRALSRQSSHVRVSKLLSLTPPLREMQARPYRYTSPHVSAQCRHYLWHESGGLIDKTPQNGYLRLS